MNEVSRVDILLVHRFFSTLLRDEVAKDALISIASKTFETQASVAKEGSVLGSSILRLMACSRDKDISGRHAGLRYEYADLFLNAGSNPVFPYESVHRGKTPVVQQQAVFGLRAKLRAFGVHVDPEFRDLEDHIAVELDLCAHLLEQGDMDGYASFFSETLLPWGQLFCEQLASCAQDPWYRELGLACGAFLDCAHLALEAPDAAGDCAALAEGLRQAAFPFGASLILPGAIDAQEDREIPTHCYTCGALCGMTAKVKDGILTGVAGLQGDPKSGGRLCPKGGASPKHVYSAYRLKTPLIRENGRFRKAGWDEALDLVASRLASVPEGKLAYFRGNDFANFVHEAFFEHLGCPKGTHRTMCDNSSRMANEHNLNDKRPWINYDESDYIILFGNNELATSYGQRKTAAFKKALDRGAKLVVFDPRKSETAAKATEWLSIVPGTDGAAAMGMAYVIITEDLYDKRFVADWTTGFEQFRARVVGEEDGVARTPEWAEAICGIPAETLARVAREFAGAGAKGVLSWTGLAQTPNAHWATAAIQALNGLRGTFDAPGGPSLPFKRKLGSAWRDGQKKPEKKAAPKVDSFGLWSGWSPANFEDQVRDGRIKALFSYWADPVLTWGNSESVARGLEKLDFCVTVDAFMCNTALYSDVVLPDSTWLEQQQVKPDWLYEAFLSYFAEVVPPMYDSRPMYRIIEGLAQRMGVTDAVPWKNMEEAFANQMRDLPWSFEELREKGFILTDAAEYYKYRKWESINPPAGYGSSGSSRTGKYNFLNPVSVEKGVDPLPDFKSIEQDLLPDAEYPFLFGNIRLLQHEHCSTFNNYQLMKLRKTNTLLINTADAAKHGISSGDLVQLSSPWGITRIKADVTDDIRPGVLAAAGGYGHVRGLEGDPKYPDMGGVNVPGALMPPNRTESTGGTPLLKYIKTRVERAA